jgi:hypothetical protein
VSRGRDRDGPDLDQRALLACVVVLSALCGALLATGIRRASGTPSPQDDPPEPPAAPRRRSRRAAAFDRSVSVIAAASAVAALITGWATVPRAAPGLVTAAGGANDAAGLAAVCKGGSLSVVSYDVAGHVVATPICTPAGFSVSGVDSPIPAFWGNPDYARSRNSPGAGQGHGD